MQQSDTKFHNRSRCLQDNSLLLLYTMDGDELLTVGHPQGEGEVMTPSRKKMRITPVSRGSPPSADSDDTGFCRVVSVVNSPGMMWRTSLSGFAQASVHSAGHRHGLRPSP